MSDLSGWRKGKRLARRVLDTPPEKLGLLLKAFFLLLCARVALRVVPVSRIIGWKRRNVRGSGLAAGQAAARRREVRWAVLAVVRHSPVRFVCFPQCLAASALLAGAGIESRLHYGVRRAAETARLETHTWLEAGGELVIGGEVAGDFSPLEVY